MKPKVVIDQEQALKNLIKKYGDKPKQIHGCVYRLSYAGKFVIVKGKTLVGSLVLIQKGYSWYRGDEGEKKGVYYLYPHFYRHIKENPQGRFRVKVLLRSTKPYFLLKKEQTEYDLNKYNPAFLNNSHEAYIPIYREITGMFGWIDHQSVLSFRRFLKSPARKQTLKDIELRQQAQTKRVS